MTSPANETDANRAERLIRYAIKTDRIRLSYGTLLLITGTSRRLTAVIGLLDTGIATSLSFAAYLAARFWLCSA